MYDFFTNKAQRQIAEIQMRKAMCECKGLTASPLPTLDWTKPLQGVHTGCDVFLVGRSGEYYVVTYTIPGETKPQSCIVDACGRRLTDTRQVVKNKPRPIKTERVAIEVWRSTSGAFHTRPWKAGSKPIENHDPCGIYDVNVSYRS